MVELLNYYNMLKPVFASLLFLTIFLLLGGVSDRGYSSLSNDDGRKLSHINGSQDSLNKLRKASQTTPVFKRLFTPSKGTDGLKRGKYKSQ